MTASAMTVGTKMRLTSSASRAMGALELCASRTSFMIRDKAVSAPTRSARIIKEPVVFIVPPATELPTPTGTGMDSPVSMEASTLDAPFVTNSVNRNPPARFHLQIVPHAHNLDREPLRPDPPCRERAGAGAVSGVRFMSAPMASDMRNRETASRYLPSEISEISTAADS